MAYRLSCILIILLLWGCKSSTTHVDKKPEPATTIVTTLAKDSFETGKVISPVSCNNNPSQSFALYLPKNYSATATYPVVYFFDAHASGRLPLDNYFSLADKFNFILVGSNDSKNGMQPEALMSIANNLIQDVQKRLQISSSRQYVGGFSGGARVAGMVAMQTQGVAGLIACSAGININNQTNLAFAVVGIGGKEDFNMNELVSLNNQLDNTAVPHQLLLFDGKHEWCPLATMSDAFLFLETVAMKNKSAIVDNGLLNNFKSSSEKEAKKLQAANRLAEAAAVYQKLIHYLDGLQDTKNYKQALTTIQNNRAYQTERKQEEQLAAQENQLREQYMRSFGKEILWWKNEVSKINEEIKRQESNPSAFMLKRMLGSLSLASYMQANSALNTNQLEKAAYVVQVYCIVDPTNSEAWYMSAELHAKQGDTNASLQDLEKAIDNGFKERERAMNDPAFSSVANTTTFISLLNKIKI